MNLQFMSPLKRMFVGFGLIGGTLLVSAAAIALIVAFTTMIGFLYTALLVLIFLFFITVFRIVRRVRALGHRFNTVREWNTDIADLEGSTARYGLPHDHGSFMSRRKDLKGRPSHSGD